MSSGNRYKCLHLESESDEASQESHKRSKIVYTRDFLISLCALDACKKLPSGLDLSLLCELEIYSKSSPGGSSKGLCGKWENGPNGKNGKDIQYSRADPGRGYNNQYQRSWKNIEHEGLLGSGAFHRIPACIVAPLVPKVQGNTFQKPKRNDELYCPQYVNWPNKLVPNFGRESKDSCNDETFGAVECTSQAKAEEEERRRASFEFMRKEQQNGMTGKQKQIGDGHKENSDLDTFTSQENASCVIKSNELERFMKPQASDADSSCSFLSAQNPASRPLLPPGFRSNMMGKNVKAKALPCSSEVEHDNNKANCSKTPSVILPKFSDWFLEEEETQAHDVSPGNEKSQLQLSGVSGGKNSILNSWNFSSESIITAPRPNSDINIVSEQLYSGTKPTLSSPAITCKDLGQSILSVSHRHTSIQQIPLQDKCEKQQPCSDNDGAVSQDLLSLAQKRACLKYLAASSKSKVGSSEDQLFDSCSFDMLSKEDAGNSQSNMLLKRFLDSRFMNMQSDDKSISAERATVRRLSDDVSDSASVFTCNISPAATTERIVASDFNKQTDLGMIKFNQMGSHNGHPEFGANLQIGRKMELSPATESTEKADLAIEYCLPEEDSLITVDDTIVPENSLFMPTGNFAKGGLSTSCSSIDMTEKLVALNIPLGDERPAVPCLGGPTFLHRSYSGTGLGTSYHSSNAQQSNPQFHQTNLNSRCPYVQSLGFNHSHLISQARAAESKSYYHNSLYHDGDFHSNLHFNTSQNTHAERTIFDHQSPSQQMHMLEDNSYLSELTRGSRPPQSVNQVAYYAEGLNPQQRFQRSCQQLSHGNLGMLNEDSGSVGGNNTQAMRNRLISMERRAKQICLAAHANGEQVAYGKWVDTRHWYENRSHWY